MATPGSPFSKLFNENPDKLINQAGRLQSEADARIEWLKRNPGPGKKGNRKFLMTAADELGNTVQRLEKSIPLQSGADETQVQKWQAALQQIRSNEQAIREYVKPGVPKNISDLQAQASKQHEAIMSKLSEIKGEPDGATLYEFNRLEKELHSTASKTEKAINDFDSLDSENDELASVSVWKLCAEVDEKLKEPRDAVAIEGFHKELLSELRNPPKYPIAEVPGGAKTVSTDKAETLAFLYQQHPDKLSLEKLAQCMVIYSQLPNVGNQEFATEFNERLLKFADAQIQAGAWNEKTYGYISAVMKNPFPQGAEMENQNKLLQEATTSTQKIAPKPV